MKKIIVTLICIISFSGFNMAFGDIINVPAGQPDALVNAVNSAIDGDILILARGGRYPNTTVVEVLVDITIQASEGEGALPEIFALPNTEGAYSHILRMNTENLVVKNIRFNGERQDQPWGGLAIYQQVLPSNKLHVDGCVFHNNHIAVITYAACDTVIVENCLMANLAGSGLDQGHAAHLRNNYHGYIRMQNNTIVVAQGYIFHREGWGNTVQASAQIPTFICDHNTVLNVWAGYGAPCQFNRIEYVQITNNLLINMHMRGSESISANALDYPENEDELYENASIVTILGPKGLWLFTAETTDSAGTEIVMQNNNIYSTADLHAEWAKSDKVSPPHLYTNQFASVLKDTINHAFKEELTFGNAPVAPAALVAIIVNNVDTMSVLGNPLAGVHPYEGMQANFDKIEPADLDMTYSTSSASYTKAAGGFPLGDLNWFPDKKAAWIAAGKPTLADPNSVEEKIASVPNAFSLEQNYPNPFNPSTTINYKLPITNYVELSIFNLLGQKVAILVSEKQEAGTHQIEWGASDYSSGIYYYRLETENDQITKKMILLK